MPTKHVDRYPCQECGMVCGARDYHPFLYCELFKLGHRDPESYLRGYDFVRQPAEIASR